MTGPAAALLLATACQVVSPSATPAAPAAPTTRPASAAQPGAVGAPIGTTPAAPAGWKRPLDVAPVAEQGTFKIVAQQPAPGDKVRVFFLGAQF